MHLPTLVYTNFYSFVPLRYKRIMIHTLMSRAEKSCSEYMFPEELECIRLLPREDGYPESFNRAKMQQKRTQPVVLTVKRKPILQLPYKVEVTSDFLFYFMHSDVPTPQQKCKSSSLALRG